MRYRYLVGIASRPVPSLSGSKLRPRPVLAVRITGPRQFAVRDALLDTGADDTVFPEKIAAVIGVDLSQATARDVHLAGRGPLLCRYAPVLLRISDFTETYEWTAVVGFVPVALHYPLLGYAGFFQFFDADFHGADQEVVLTPNRLFPGKRI